MCGYDSSEYSYHKRRFRTMSGIVNEHWANVREASDPRPNVEDKPMNKINMSLILTAAIFLIAACSVGGPQQEKEPPAKPSPPKPAGKTDPQKPQPSPVGRTTPEAPKSDLKPEDADPEKPFDVAALNNAVKADQEAWKGKKVTVVGKHNGESISKVADGKYVDIQIRSSTGGDTVARCSGRVLPPKDSLGATVFRGTVNGLRFGALLLEPCEIVK